MQNRRNFLKQASLMLAGGLVAPQLLSSCGGKSGQAAATASESLNNIGLAIVFFKRPCKRRRYPESIGNRR